MTHRALALLIVAGWISGCRETPARAVVVVVTATPLPIAQSTPVAVEPPLTAAVQSAEFVFPVAQPTAAPAAPTAMPVAESAFEPRREPTPAGLHEQMEKCLDLRAEKDPRPVTTDYLHSVYARVTARNNCEASLPGWDAWVEVSVILPVGGRGLVGREFAHFEGPIAGRGNAETFVRITNERIDPNEFYRFDVALWPEAGSGRKPE